MPNQEDVLLRTMPGTELSRARTELFESFGLLPDLVRAVLVLDKDVRTGSISCESGCRNNRPCDEIP